MVTILFPFVSYEFPLLRCVLLFMILHPLLQNFTGAILPAWQLKYDETEDGSFFLDLMHKDKMDQ